MEKIDFLPVLLASDINVYSMARAFHEAYGIKSLMVARQRGSLTELTKIVDYIECPNLNQTEAFLAQMDEIAEKYGKGRKLLLLGCADHYVRLIVENKEYLSKKFILPYSDKAVLDNITLKEDFYKLCDKAGLDYAKTFIYKPEMNFEFELNFDFPVVLKASDSVKFHAHKFQGFHKAYFIYSKAELVQNLKLIYANGYDDHMVIQEMVPGGDDSIYDLQMYIGKDHKAKMLNLGNVLLEEHTPTAIGNNAATLTCYNKDLMLKVGGLLESIGYEGFADADIKYDCRDGKYKMFEINIRQGRSNYRVTGGGVNLAKLVVDDYIYNKPLDLVMPQGPHFWHVVPLGVVYKYVQNKEKLAIVKDCVKKGLVCDSQRYSKDLSLKRRIYLALRNLNMYRKFRLYYPKNNK